MTPRCLASRPTDGEGGNRSLAPAVVLRREWVVEGGKGKGARVKKQRELKVRAEGDSLRGLW